MLARTGGAETRHCRRGSARALVFVAVRSAPGTALLHADRKARWMRLEQTDGTVFRIPIDGFPDADRILTALQKAGVPLDENLRRQLGRKPERRSDAPETVSS